MGGFKQWADGWSEGWGEGWIGGFKEWVDGVMGLRVGFININDMYKMAVGKGGVQAYEGHEVE